MAEGRGSHTSTLLPDGRVLIVGDLRRNGSLSTTQLWDPDLRPDSSENPSPSPTPPGPPPSAPPVPASESDALAP
jgi:hypothetical protein